MTDGHPHHPNLLEVNQDPQSQSHPILSLMQLSSPKLIETKVSNLVHHLKILSKNTMAILNSCSESLKTCHTMIQSSTLLLWTLLSLEKLRITKRLCSSLALGTALSSFGDENELKLNIIINYH